MKLYRNIGLNEMFKLASQEVLKGKLHDENEDSDYIADEYGPSIFFFNDEVNLIRLGDYSFLIEVEIPSENISGSGFARYTSSPPCDCCEPTVFKYPEYYVKQYDAALNLRVVDFEIDYLREHTDASLKLSAHLIWEGLISSFLDSMSDEEIIETIINLSDDEIASYLDNDSLDIGPEDYQFAEDIVKTREVLKFMKRGNKNENAKQSSKFKHTNKVNIFPKEEDTFGEVVNFVRSNNIPQSKKMINKGPKEGETFGSFKNSMTSQR